MQKEWFWILVLTLIAFFLVLMSYDADWIEKHYSLGLYPPVALFFRWLTGWARVSLGDMVYLAIGCNLAYLFVKGITLILKRRLSKQIIFRRLKRLIVVLLIIYVLFNVFWGLNYDRKGIVSQLKLDTAKYTTDDLVKLQERIVANLNSSKKQLLATKASYPNNNNLFARAGDCFKKAAEKFSFFEYRKPSVKPSLYSWWGSYLGFTGYYNPFSGEAQINIDVPKFILPFTTCHEIAHQLGYASENEANFAGFLAATSSGDELFKYSAYLDVFLYANRELYFTDTLLAKRSFELLDTSVVNDIKAYRAFILRHNNLFEPIITWLYGNYLKANQQPKGIKTYSEVIAYLMAYYKKYGKLEL